jgi:signal recognition particle subunit SRP54
MFEDLSDKLRATFHNLSQKGRLTEQDVDVAMREVKLALLEADVNFKVVREFVKVVKEQAIGQEILKTLNPSEMVVKIVYDELVRILGEAGRLNLNGKPTVIMMVGLQGSGKTTSTAKIAGYLKKQGYRPLLIACDTYRPAAVKQLEVVGSQVGVKVYSEGTAAAPPQIALRGLQEAQKNGYNVVLVDTAGRLNIDEQMMAELDEIKRLVTPHEVLFVADAMTGQEAVNVAKDFHARVNLTGVVFTKVDGDARGGAALSIREVTGVPIKFLGVGEKLDGIELFHPDRLAGRILGRGDLLSLLEKAEQAFDTDEAERMGSRLEQGEFDFEDFLAAMGQMKKLGPITKIMGMIPGMGDMARQLEPGVMEAQMKKIEAIVQSMTRAERRNPRLLIKGQTSSPRKKRIARGSGTQVQDINELVKQFQEMQKMVKQMPMLMAGNKKGNQKGNRRGGGGSGGFKLPFDIPGLS